MAGHGYTAIRVEKKRGQLVVIGLGRSARGSQFYRQAVKVEGDTKDRTAYKQMLTQAVTELGYTEE